MADKGLTIKQERYVQGLFAGLSQRESYKRAYDAENMKDATIDRNAYTLAISNKIATRVVQLQNEFKERNMVTVEWVLKRLVALNDRCMQAAPVLDNKGMSTGEWKFESNAANRSLELIGKHLGMFIEKVESKNINENHNYDSMTTEQLEQELEKLGYKKA